MRSCNASSIGSRRAERSRASGPREHDDWADAVTSTSSAPAAFTFPPPSLKPEGFYGFCHVIVRIAARFWLSLGAGEVEGRENIPASGGFVIASNHCSFFDPPILAIASPRPLSYFAKQELFANPYFSAVIQKLGAFPVERGSGDQAALARAIQLLTAGYALVIFPEGTRSRDGRLARAKLGAALMAVKANVPILPVFIDGSFQAWPKGGAIRRAPVRVRIGAPLYPDGVPDSARGYAALTTEWTRSLIALGATPAAGPSSAPSTAPAAPSRRDRGTSS